MYPCQKKNKNTWTAAESPWREDVVLKVTLHLFCPLSQLYSLHKYNELQLVEETLGKNYNNPYLIEINNSKL